MITHKLLFPILFIILASCKQVEDSNPVSLALTDPPGEMEKSERPMQILNDNVRWLTDNSDLVFIGHLKSIETGLDQNGMIYTNHSFEVEESIKGDISDQAVEIKTLGGEHNGEIMKVSHMPVFLPDVQYLVFTNPDNPGYTALTGNEHGVFILQDDEVYTIHGYVLSAIEDDRIVTGVRQIDVAKTDTRREGNQVVRENPQTTNPDLVITTTLRDQIMGSEAVMGRMEFVKIIQSFIQ